MNVGLVEHRVSLESLKSASFTLSSVSNLPFISRSDEVSELDNVAISSAGNSIWLSNTMHFLIKVLEEG